MFAAPSPTLLSFADCRIHGWQKPRLVDRNGAPETTFFFMRRTHAACNQYAISFYLSYLSRWPDMCAIQETPQGRMMGYGMFLTALMSQSPSTDPTFLSVK